MDRLKFATYWLAAMLLTCPDVTQAAYQCAGDANTVYQDETACTTACKIAKKCITAAFDVIGNSYFNGIPFNKVTWGTSPNTNPNIPTSVAQNSPWIDFQVALATSTTSGGKISLYSEGDSVAFANAPAPSTNEIFSDFRPIVGVTTAGTNSLNFVAVKSDFSGVEPIGSISLPSGSVSVSGGVSQDSVTGKYIPVSRVATDAGNQLMFLYGMTSTGNETTIAQVSISSPAESLHCPIKFDANGTPTTYVCDANSECSVPGTCQMFSGLQASASIMCGSDLNGNGAIDQNEYMQCKKAVRVEPGGTPLQPNNDDICPVGAVNCSTNCPTGYSATTPYIYVKPSDHCELVPQCSPGTIYNKDSDRCEMPTTCIGGMLNPATKMCEATITCPPATGTSLNLTRNTCQAPVDALCPTDPDGTAYTWDKALDMCVKAVKCPESGTLNGNTDKCEKAVNNVCTDPSYTYDSNPASPSYNQCVKTAGCSSGNFNSSSDRCESAPLPTCDTAHGYSYNSASNKCERPASNLCTTGTYNASLNVCTTGYSTLCKAGYSLNGSLCEAPPVCSQGTFNGSTKKCEWLTTNTQPSGVYYSCPTGTSLNGSTCSNTYGGSVSGYTCPSGTLSGNKCVSTYDAPISSYNCTSGTLGMTGCETTYGATPTYSCPAGSLSGTNCLTTYDASTPGYTCASGSLSGTNCVSTYGASPAGYTCSVGDVNGSDCDTHYGATVSYLCSDGALSGTDCVSTYGATPSYSCSSGTLSGETCTISGSYAATNANQWTKPYHSSYFANNVFTGTKVVLIGAAYAYAATDIASLVATGCPSTQAVLWQTISAWVSSPYQDTYLHPGSMYIWACQVNIPQYSCPSGGTLNGITCNTTSSVPATVTNSCSGSDVVSGTQCIHTVSATPVYNCNSGDVLYNGTQCTHKTSATPVYSCNSGDDLSGTTCTKTIPATSPVYSCNAGDSLSGTTCTHSATANVSYSCTAGDAILGTTCTHTTPKIPVYYCNGSDILSGSTCTNTVPATPVYACTAGDALAGSTCTHTIGATPNYTCPAGYNNSADPTICVQTVTNQISPSCNAGGIFGWTAKPSSNVCTTPIIKQCDTANGFTYDSGADTCIKDVACPSTGALNGIKDICEMTPGKDCGTATLDNIANVCFTSVVCTNGSYSSGLKECTGNLNKDCGSYTLSASNIQLCQKIPNCPADPAFAASPAYSESLNLCNVTPAHNCATQYNYVGLPVETCEANPVCINGTQIPGTALCSYPVNCGPYTADLSVTPPVCQVGVNCPNGSLDGNIDKCVAARTLGCPAGNFSCWDAVGDFSWQCSPNMCGDLTTNPLTSDNVTSAGPTADGQKDPDTGQCQDQIQIFPGKSKACRVPGTTTGWSDCCDKSLAPIDASSNTGAFGTAMGAVAGAAGAAAMLGLMSTGVGAIIAVIAMVATMVLKCDSDDIDTVKNLNKGKCHYVGQYCRQKWPLVGCVQQAKAYCCFDSMLSRIVQEQGRPMISTFNPSALQMTDPVRTGTSANYHFRGTDQNIYSQGWLLTPGGPTSPGNLNCRGFTMEEFTLVDMSNVDLTEWVDSMVAKLNGVVAEKTVNAPSSIESKVRNSMQNINN